MSTQPAKEHNVPALEYGTCPVCGQITMPVLEMPPCGHDEDPIRAPLEAPGSIYSWTRALIGDTDVLMVMVDFFDGKLRVTAPLLDGIDPEIGQEVFLVEGRDTPYAFLRRS